MKAVEEKFSFVENTDLSYHYIHPQTISVLSKLRKSKISKLNFKYDK